jgi:hypothetical protein
MKFKTAIQPKPVKLPATLRDGRRIKEHPLVWYVKHQMGERNKSDLSRHMGVRPQSLYKWLAEGRKDRNYLIPATRAAQVAQFFGVHPGLFRPDVSWPAPSTSLGS